MRVLLILNRPNRETLIMESIKREILAIDPTVQILIIQRYAVDFYRVVFKFRPNIIVTYPFTSVGLSTWHYLFKLLFRCKIISLRAEGVINSSEEHVHQFTGYDRYGRNLVDYELFWGPKMAEIIGKNLLRVKKISSLNRIKVYGYPRLEAYFNDDRYIFDSCLPPRIIDKIKQYTQDNIVFFITGFVYATYTREDLIRAGDLNAEEKIDAIWKEVEFTKRYRKAWVDNIIRTAKENPDALIIVKKHPTEVKQDYAVLETVKNILYIYEDIEIQTIMPHAGIYIHYGSTSLVDAYLTGIPSVYAYPEDIVVSSSWYSDFGWPSTRQVLVSDIPELVTAHLTTNLRFTMTDDIKQLLKINFNIDLGSEYAPSKEIARLILNDEPPLKVPWTDIYLWRSLTVILYQSMRLMISKMLKRLMGKDPDQPLRKRIKRTSDVPS